MVRAAIAVTEGAGRNLRFVSTDEGALGPSTLRWCLIDGYSDLPLTDAFRTGEEVFLPTLSDLGRRYPDIFERQRTLGTRSMAAIPLVRDTERLGGLLLCYDTPHEFDPMERAFLSAFAMQVTQAVRRGLAYQIQYTNSEQLQRSLMPHSLPNLEGLALGSYYQPGGFNVDVGGDWYDVLELPDGSVAVSLGDVMGKGVEAAIVMSEVRSAARAYAMLDAAPSVVLGRLDALVSSLRVSDQIVTMVYGVIAPDRESITLSVAGHPPPLLVPREGCAEVLDGYLGPALGLGSLLGFGPGRTGAGPFGPWLEQHVKLSPESTLLFYSDGLVESREVDLGAGIESLSDFVSGVQAGRRGPRELCARLGELVRREDADDDVTVLAAGATSSRAAQSDFRRLPADPSSASLARRFVRDRLSEWSLDEDVTGVAELLVSELVTNAVMHSGTEPEVRLELDERAVLILVHDRGQRGTVQQNLDYQPLSVSGRGLTLVDALASAWNAEHNADGTTVWFELALNGDDSGAVGASAGAGSVRGGD